MAFVSKRAINSELMQVLADVLGERGRQPRIEGETPDG
jgi:hypothetical protein